MNTFGFRPGGGFIVVDAEMTGPLGSAALKLVLDTGATKSLVSRTALIALGFDPDASGMRATMATGSTVEVVPLVILTRLSALGRNRFVIPVIAHTLPPQSAVDGLLGLDFFPGEVLTIDFRAGQITLS